MGERQGSEEQTHPDVLHKTWRNIFWGRQMISGLAELGFIFGASSGPWSGLKDFSYLSVGSCERPRLYGTSLDSR